MRINPMTHPHEGMHVDDFIDDCLVDDRDKKYAQFFFHLHRLPAVMQGAWAEWIKPFKLFCTYEGKRYRVTGASRMGDVWLAKDFEREVGYDKRVDLEQCSDFKETL